ncbi:MAG TPA: hypothetical protein VLM83_09935, partial [Anaerolineales bacterium]|nr:hypothetical protein [Anaerolineales bacterium]
MHSKQAFILILTLALALGGSLPAPARAQSQAATPDLLGQIGGAVTAAVYQDNYIGLDTIYLGVGPRLYVLQADQTNPLAPTLTVFGVSQLLPNIIQDIQIMLPRAYVALGEGGLGIINLANPAAPATIAVYDTPGYANELWLTSTL